MGNAWMGRIDLSRGMEPKLAKKVLAVFGNGQFLDRASSGKFVSAWCKYHGKNDVEQVAADFWNNYSNKEGRITKQVLTTLEIIVNPEIEGIILHSKKVILHELSAILPPPLAEIVYQFQDGMGGAFLRKWGSRGTQPGQFKRPVDVKVSRGPDPEVFVLDSGNSRVQVFDLSGVFQREFHPGAPVAFEVGWREVFVLGNYSVQVYSLEGSLLRTFGARGMGAHEFNEEPVHVAVSRSDDVFVLCGTRIKVFHLNGDFVRSVDLGWAPAALALSATELFLLRAHQVVVMDQASCTFQRSWGVQGSGNGALWVPQGIAVSGQEVLVSDLLNHRVQVFRLDGSYSKKWDAFGSRNGQFNSPRGVAITTSGELLVADTGNNRIQMFFCCHDHEETQKRKDGRKEERKDEPAR